MKRINWVLRFVDHRVLPVLSLILLFLLIIFPTITLNGAGKGLQLWLFTILPIQLPFFILTGYLIKTDILKIINRIFSGFTNQFLKLPGSSAFVLFTGILGGYPMGAKFTCELYKMKGLTKAQANRLLMFTSYASPLFITGVVCTVILKTPALSLYILAIHILSGIFIGIISSLFISQSGIQPTTIPITDNEQSTLVPQIDIDKPSLRTHLSKKKLPMNNSSTNPMNGSKIKNMQQLNSSKKTDYVFGKLISDSMKDSLQTILYVGGFIIFFAVFVEFLKNSIINYVILEFTFLHNYMFDISQNIVASIIYGFFEMTNGVANLPSTSRSGIIELSAAALITAWGGISVHMQCAGIISDHGLSVKTYIIGKWLHALISSGATYIFFYFNSSLLL